MTSSAPQPRPESLSERLARLFGPGTDPGISLAPVGADEPVSDLVAELLRAGCVAERYELRGEIDRGGMGVVLDVWDRDLRRPLAMKIALDAGGVDDALAPDRRRLLRFLEEAQITGQLDHPGIVPVHELGVDAEGRVFFTMRRVRGRDLREVFHCVRFGLDGWTRARALGVLLRICETLAFAHSRGVLHRDIKPANVMVGAYGEVYVMDWGLARVIGRPQPSQAASADKRGSLDTLLRDERRRSPDSPLVTGDGDVMGTPAYMPPEQARGEREELSPRGDVYSVGALLYHLCAGEAPYHLGERQTKPVDVLESLRSGPPRPLAELQPGLPPELVAISEKAMAHDLAERYADMDALAHDLRALLEGRVVAALEQGAWAETRKWIQRNRALAAAMAAGVVLLVAGLLVSLDQRARADAKALEAFDNQQRASENERLARAETAKVLRLSDVKVLEELQEESDALWPPYPGSIAALEAWLQRATRLAANLPTHRALLASMRARALPSTPEQRARDRATYARAGELDEARSELDGLIARLEQGLTGDARAQADARVVVLETELEALTAERDARRTWSFDAPVDQWQYDVLQDLVQDLEALAARLPRRTEATEGPGWSEARRMAFATRLEAGFADGGEYERAWTRDLPAIRAAYPGLDLEPQMGLVPLGPDPQSGLWEFAHLITGEPPRRDGDGRLVATEEMGVVLVLLRGGKSWLGAQRSNPSGVNYDPQAAPNEGPVHQVDLSAYMLSKYEMTQAQWKRLTGLNPSFYKPPGKLAPSLMHPVEQVSWLDCMEWLPRAGLALPSEAQWEQAARAGTDSPWWSGTDRESLREQHAANLADQAAARVGASWDALKDWPDLDDGAAAHAPVGTFAANRFGLHDVAGNLWEWCQDEYRSDHDKSRHALDDVDITDRARSRSTRGGSYSAAAQFARSATRYGASPSNAIHFTGVRPARALDP